MTAKPPGGSESASDGVALAHSRLLADNQIQFEFPEPAAAPPPPAQVNWGVFDFLNSSAMTVIFWILVALLALFIFYQLGRRWVGRSRAGGSAEESEESLGIGPSAIVARRLLDEADQLAAQGQFDQAVHLLLFRSVEDIDNRRPGLLRPALTRRDIAGLAELPERARTAFTRIAQTVERSLFARRELASSDWSECRSAYEHFAFVDAWR